VAAAVALANAGETALDWNTGAIAAALAATPVRFPPVNKSDILSKYCGSVVLNLSKTGFKNGIFERINTFFYKTFWNLVSSHYLCRPKF
jgi:hypothetical protein